MTCITQNIKYPSYIEVYPPKKQILYITWRSYYDTAKRLAYLIQNSGFQFDTIICIARGGMPIGDYLSRCFKVPLGIIIASSYKDNETQQSQLQISNHIAVLEKMGKQILLVDDLVENGTTLAAVKEFIETRFYPTTVKTAVLWFKVTSCITPDFYVGPPIKKETWIEQPFENPYLFPKL